MLLGRHEYLQRHQIIYNTVIVGMEALYPKPNLSRPAPGLEVYPYLLHGISIERPKSGVPILRYIPMSFLVASQILHKPEVTRVLQVR